MYLGIVIICLFANDWKAYVANMSTVVKTEELMKTTELRPHLRVSK